MSPPPAALQPLFTFAYQDPVLLQDSRVFRNMLDIEEFYLAASNYFQVLPGSTKIPQLTLPFLDCSARDQAQHAADRHQLDAGGNKNQSSSAIVIIYIKQQSK